MSRARVLLAGACALGNGLLLAAFLTLPVERAAAEPAVTPPERAAATAEASPAKPEVAKKPEATESLPKRVTKKARKLLSVRDFGGY